MPFARRFVRGLPTFVSATVALLFAVAGPASAQTNNSYPMLMSLKPAAAQVGATTEHEVSARYNLYGASKVIVSGSGVTGEVIPPEVKPGEKPPEKKPNTPKAKVRFTVAPDAVPGVRDFRVITPQGASTVGQLVVGRDPVVAENPDNDTLAKAQLVNLPATICGTIEKAEDLDFYKFKIDAPTGLVFEVRSQRLLNRLHDMQIRVDPLITLRNATGGVLATSDNHFAGDPLLFYQFTQPGDYVLEVRDVRYQGNADWTYAVEVHNRPFVTQVSPLALVPGVATQLTLVGYNLPAGAQAPFTLPADTPAGLRAIAPVFNGQPLNDVTVLSTKSAITLEAPQPNNTVEQAQTIAIPTVVAGTIESESDVDCFTFEAKAGDRLSFRVVARQAWSAIDPFLRILNDKGALVSEADDSTVDRVQTADSWLENWGAPADGKYTLEIRDLHLRGGAQFTYAIEITRAQPHFLLEVDTDKTLLAPGSGGVFYVRALRKNGFAGDVILGVEGLPAGVTAITGRILAGANDGCVILHAAPDAKFDASNIRVLGSATHAVPNAEPLQLSAVGQPLQEYYSPGGGRGNYPVDMHTVSIAEPMDVRSVKLSATDIKLKPGESRKIDVTIERAPGFTGNVTLDVLFQHLESPFGNSLPKGVTLDGANSKTLLTGTETQGVITLKAAADAPVVEKQLIPVMAHVSINFVMKMTFAGEPVWVTVEK
ncbi:MAG: hypothetical protein NT069_22460 [Planctomycetota bacterium]|nr:hypothetical protein [Planctomycetota bacterium]